MYEVTLWEAEHEWSFPCPTIEIVPYNEIGKLIYKWLTDYNFYHPSISVRWKS